MKNHSTKDINERFHRSKENEKDKAQSLKKIFLYRISGKEKIANDFFQYLYKLFNRFEEIKKPINDRNFINNANYIYYKYKIWDEQHVNFLEENEVKHLIIEASDKLKNLILVI
ncbi:MAG: hypothetical protein ACTSRI_05700 [Promethearchaeota archaeon]